MDTAAKTAHLTTFQPKGHLKDQAFDAELYARVGGVPEHSVSLMARASNGVGTPYVTVPTNAGGATVFVLDVDQFEKF